MDNVQDESWNSPPSSGPRWKRCRAIVRTRSSRLVRSPTAPAIPHTRAFLVHGPGGRRWALGLRGWDGCKPPGGDECPDHEEDNGEDEDRRSAWPARCERW